MTTLSGSVRAQLISCVLAIGLVNVWSLPVWADARQDAVAELDRLHQSPLSDEVKSAEATFAVAERYFQNNDVEQARRFYLLTIQKARVIQSAPTTSLDAIPASANTPSASGTPVPTGEAADIPQQTRAIPSIVPPTSATATAKLTTPAVEAWDLDQGEVINSERLVGNAGTYSVVKGDTIRLVAAKLGVSRQHLIKKNRLDETAYLKVGQKLRFNNRKIVPQRMKNGIVVNIPDCTLYYFRQGRLAASLPVALGVPAKSDKHDWKTPIGKFKITAKMKDPTWHVPPSIQSEMEDQGKEIITKIPPGPGNPLGKYAIKTSLPGILIHSTTKPWSIYGFASHGCIRVSPDQMESFFKEVAIDTPGEIIYKPVKLAITEQGRIFLEVHRDIYSKNSNGLAQETKRLIEKLKLAERVDWKKVESMVRTTSGIAEDISL